MLQLDSCCDQWLFNGRRKRLAKHLLPVFEDLLDFSPYEQTVNQVAAGHAVVDDVDHAGAVFARFEQVFVVPELVGALEGFIDEAFVGFPGGDFRLPADGHTAESQFVIDQLPGVHLDWPWGQHAEVQPGWCDGLELIGIGEERGKPLRPLRGKIHSARRT